MVHLQKPYSTLVLLSERGCLQRPAEAPPRLGEKAVAKLHPYKRTEKGGSIAQKESPRQTGFWVPCKSGGALSGLHSWSVFTLWALVLIQVFATMPRGGKCVSQLGRIGKLVGFLVSLLFEFSLSNDHASSNLGDVRMSEPDAIPRSATGGVFPARRAKTTSVLRSWAPRDLLRLPKKKGHPEFWELPLKAEDLPSHSRGTGACKRTSPRVLFDLS